MASVDNAGFRGHQKGLRGGCGDKGKPLSSKWPLKATLSPISELSPMKSRMPQYPRRRASGALAWAGPRPGPGEHFLAAVFLLLSPVARAQWDRLLPPHPTKRGSSLLALYVVNPGLVCSLFPSSWTPDPPPSESSQFADSKDISVALHPYHSPSAEPCPPQGGSVAIKQQVLIPLIPQTCHYPSTFWLCELHYSRYLV